jgi:hypothetical protein
MWVGVVVGLWIFYPQFYVRNIYKLLLPQHKTLLSVTKTNLFKEGKQIVIVHLDSHVKPINESSGNNEEILNVGIWLLFLTMI